MLLPRGPGPACDSFSWPPCGSDIRASAITMGDAMPPPDRSLYTKPFVLAAAGNFLFFASLNVYTLLPLYIQQLGGREGQIGTIMAMYSIAAIVCQLGTGPLVDRFGRKPFLLLGAALTIAVSTTFVFSTRLGWHFYLLRFLQGAAFAGFMTSNLTLLADLAPASRRAEAVGVFGVSGLVTIALAPAAGEMVLRAYGFRALFVGAALLGIATLAVCLATDVPAPMAVEASRRLGPGFWRTFTPVVVLRSNSASPTRLCSCSSHPLPGTRAWRESAPSTSCIPLWRWLCDSSAGGWPIAWSGVR